MVHDKFFISDTHFFHSNILKFTNEKGERIRGQFPLPQEGGVEAMHEYMVEKWNSVVKENDYVYHLGDVTFRYDGAFAALMRCLNGKKRLVVGNHDKIWDASLMEQFERAWLWKGFKEHNFTCSHMPLRLDALRDGAYCVHGHTHERVMKHPYFINVCVETRDYTPVHLDQIKKEINDVVG